MMKTAKIVVREDGTCCMYTKLKPDINWQQMVDFHCYKAALDYTKSVGCVFTLVEFGEDTTFLTKNPLNPQFSEDENEVTLEDGKTYVAVEQPWYAACIGCAFYGNTVCPGKCWARNDKRNIIWEYKEANKN